MYEPAICIVRKKDSSMHNKQCSCQKKFGSGLSWAKSSSLLLPGPPFQLTKEPHFTSSDKRGVSMHSIRAILVNISTAYLLYAPIDLKTERSNFWLVRFVSPSTSSAVPFSCKKSIMRKMEKRAHRFYIIFFPVCAGIILQEIIQYLSVSINEFAKNIFKICSLVFLWLTGNVRKDDVFGGHLLSVGHSKKGECSSHSICPPHT